MNVRVLFLLLFVFVAQFGFAQEFKGGIKVGPILSQIDGDVYSGYHKLGVTGGVFVNRDFADKLFWQFGLQYAMKGSQRRDEYKCVLHYVEFPITIGYCFKEKFRVELGNALGYNMNQYEERNGSEILDAKEFRKFELSGIAGLSYLVTDNLIASAHIYYSVLEVRKPRQFNDVISFTLAYQFEVGK